LRGHSILVLFGKQEIILSRLRGIFTGYKERDFSLHKEFSRIRSAPLGQAAAGRVVPKNSGETTKTNSQGSFLTLKPAISTNPEHLFLSGKELPNDVKSSNSPVIRLNHTQQVLYEAFLKPVLIVCEGNDFDTLGLAAIKAVDCIKNKVPFYILFPDKTQMSTTMLQRIKKLKDVLEKCHEEVDASNPVSQNLKNNFLYANDNWLKLQSCFANLKRLERQYDGLTVFAGDCPQEDNGANQILKMLSQRKFDVKYVVNFDHHRVAKGNKLRAQLFPNANHILTLNDTTEVAATLIALKALNSNYFNKQKVNLEPELVNRMYGYIAPFIREAVLSDLYLEKLKNNLTYSDYVLNSMLEDIQIKKFFETISYNPQILSVLLPAQFGKSISLNSISQNLNNPNYRVEILRYCQQEGERIIAPGDLEEIKLVFKPEALTKCSELHGAEYSEHPVFNPGVLTGHQLNSIFLISGLQHSRLEKDSLYALLRMSLINYSNSLRSQSPVAIVDKYIDSVKNQILAELKDEIVSLPTGHRFLYISSDSVVGKSFIRAFRAGIPKEVINRTLGRITRAILQELSLENQPQGSKPQDAPAVVLIVELLPNFGLVSARGLDAEQAVKVFDEKIFKGGGKDFMAAGRLNLTAEQLQKGCFKTWIDGCLRKAASQSVVLPAA
jgi:hypothetical protein